MSDDMSASLLEKEAVPTKIVTTSSSTGTGATEDYDDFSNSADIKPSPSIPGFTSEEQKKKKKHEGAGAGRGVVVIGGGAGGGDGGAEPGDVSDSNASPTNDAAELKQNAVYSKSASFQMDKDEGVDLVDPPPVRGPSSTPGRILELLHKFFMAFPVQVVMVLLTIIDIIFLIYEFSTNKTRYETLTMITSTAFMFEVLASCGHLQHNYFLFEKGWVIGEVTVVTTSFLVEYIQFLLKIIFFTKFSSWIAYLRAVRFLRVLIVWKTRSKKLSTALRRLVSADRRRLEVGGYDLDMTYVNPRVIAMSWPSDGLEGLYRNNINHVAQYLNDTHKDGYKIFNLCSERSYDESKFGYRVSRYRMDDHNPGALPLMIDFALDVDQFLKKSPKNVVIIHCKGGKGRTGTMICTHFIFSGYVETADQALSHFGRERTADEARNFQGVESPSQERYVRYFAELVRRAKAANIPIALPSAKPVRFRRIRLHFVPLKWWDVSRLWFAVVTNPSSENRTTHYLSNPTVHFSASVGSVKHKHGPKLAAAESALSDATTSTSGGGGGGARAHSGNMVAFLDGPPASKSGDDPFKHMDKMHVVQLEDLKRAQQHFIDSGSTTQTLGQDGDNNNHHNNTMSPAAAAASSEPAPPPSLAESPSAASASTFSPTEGDEATRVDVEWDCSQIAPVTGDCHLKFFFDEDNPDTLHCPLQVWVNVNMEEDNAKIRWLRPQIDGPHKDPKFKKFPREFAMSIDLEPASSS